MKKFLYWLMAFSTAGAAQTYRHITPALQSAISPGSNQVVLPANGTIYYVRPDGGTRAIADGKTDAPCVGTTTGQHCALNEFNALWQDGTYVDGQQSFPAWGWLIKGGDTVLVRGCYNTDGTTGCRVGWRNSSSPIDAASGLYTGFKGDAFDSSNPTIPAGTSAQHTMILGQNYASCSATNKTEIFGGYGLYDVLNLKGTSFVDIGCINLTRHSQCVVNGSPALPSKCGPNDDYAANGILTDQNTHDILLQNDWIHGFTTNGILGPLSGAMTLDNTQVEINGGAGWNLDNGSGVVFNGAVVRMRNGSAINWSGFNQAWPSGLPLNGYSQNHGGYGDAIGTPDGSCVAIDIDGSIFHDNVEDVGDTLHNAKTTCPYSFTNSVLYNNQGEGMKWGDGSTPVTITGNTYINNCRRHRAAIAGLPAAYNAGLDPSDDCRGGDSFTGHLNDGAVWNISNNTIIALAPVTFDLMCDVASCPNGKVTLSNNIILAYTDNGTAPGAYCFSVIGGNCNSTATGFVGTFTRSNNVWFGERNLTLAGNEKLADPLFAGELSQKWTGESELDNFNTTLAAGSPAIALNAGAGTSTTTLPHPVQPTTPTITWFTPASITAGTALSVAQLNATASTAGKMTYTPAMGSVPAAGTVTLSVVFTPSDTVDFTSATKTVQLTVMPAVVVTPPPTTIYPLSWSVQVTIPSSTVQPSAITPPLITVPAKTVNCPFTQASATAPIIAGVCK